MNGQTHNNMHSMPYKIRLTRKPRYHTPSKATKLIVDASPTALAAILTQHTPDENDETIVAYGSRALSDVEQRYSQTERKALAIVFGCEHFCLFLYGIHFTIYSDHKPQLTLPCTT